MSIDADSLGSFDCGASCSSGDQMITIYYIPCRSPSSLHCIVGHGANLGIIHPHASRMIIMSSGNILSLV